MLKGQLSQSKISNTSSGNSSLTKKSTNKSPAVKPPLRKHNGTQLKHQNLLATDHNRKDTQLSSSRDSKMSKNSKCTFKVFVGRRSASKENQEPNIVVTRQKEVKPAQGRTIKGVRQAISNNVKLNHKSNKLSSQTKLLEHKSTTKDKIKPVQVKSPFRHSPKVQDKMLKYFPKNVVEEYKKVSIDDFKILKLLDEGKYYRQYLAVHLHLNHLFSIRILNKGQVIEQERVLQIAESIKIHGYLSNIPTVNIQKLFTFFDDPFNVYLVMEPVEIDTKEQLQLSDHLLDQKQIAIILKNMLVILKEIHSHQILLRNISLMSLKRQMDVYFFTNLQTATSLKVRKRRESFLGSLKQTPHELAIGQSYDYGYDLWSIGCTLYRMITGNDPFDGRNILQKIKDLDFGIPMLVSNNLASLLSSLLTQSDRRASIQQCLKHPFLNHELKDVHPINKDIWIYWSK